MNQDTSAVLAAIDVGSNSLGMKLVRRERPDRFTTVLKRRAAVRPGASVFQTGVITGPTLSDLVSTLREWNELCAEHGAAVRTVATSAMRDAANQREVRVRVFYQAGLCLEVLSGDEEARLMCLGALAGVPADVRSLCLDIGGGSTELALAQGEVPVDRWSIALGSLRLRERFGEGDSRARIAAMREAAAVAVAVLPRPGAGRELRGVLGCSGTVRALVEFMTGDERTDATGRQIAGLVDDLIGLGRRTRERLFGEHRGELIVPAAIILEAVARRLELDWVRATRRGLRDGLLVEMSRRLGRGARWN